MFKPNNLYVFHLVRSGWMMSCNSIDWKPRFFRGLQWYRSGGHSWHDQSHESAETACAIRPRNFPLLKFIVNWPGNEYLETVGIAETLLGSPSNWPPSQPQDQEEGFLRWCAERCAVQRNPQLRGSSMTNTRFNLGIQSIFGNFTIRGTC